jgi:hypothetical protein
MPLENSKNAKIFCFQMISWYFRIISFLCGIITYISQNADLVQNLRVMSFENVRGFLSIRKPRRLPPLKVV